MPADMPAGLPETLCSTQRWSQPGSPGQTPRAAALFRGYSLMTAAGEVLSHARAAHSSRLASMAQTARVVHAHMREQHQRASATRLQFGDARATSTLSALTEVTSVLDEEAAAAAVAGARREGGGWGSGQTSADAVAGHDGGDQAEGAGSDGMGSADIEEPGFPADPWSGEDAEPPLSQSLRQSLSGGGVSSGASGSAAAVDDDRDTGPQQDVGYGWGAAAGASPPPAGGGAVAAAAAEAAALPAPTSGRRYTPPMRLLTNPPSTWQQAEQQPQLQEQQRLFGPAAVGAACTCSHRRRACSGNGPSRQQHPAPAGRCARRNEPTSPRQRGSAPTTAAFIEAEEQHASHAAAGGIPVRLGAVQPPVRETPAAADAVALQPDALATAADAATAGKGTAADGNLTMLLPTPRTWPPTREAAAGESGDRGAQLPVAGSSNCSSSSSSHLLSGATGAAVSLAKPQIGFLLGLQAQAQLQAPLLQPHPPLLQPLQQRAAAADDARNATLRPQQQPAVPAPELQQPLASAARYGHLVALAAGDVGAAAATGHSSAVEAAAAGAAVDDFMIVTDTDSDVDVDEKIGMGAGPGVSGPVRASDLPQRQEEAARASASPPPESTVQYGRVRWLRLPYGRDVAYNKPLLEAVFPAARAAALLAPTRQLAMRVTVYVEGRGVKPRPRLYRLEPLSREMGWQAGAQLSLSLEPLPRPQPSRPAAAAVAAAAAADRDSANEPPFPQQGQGLSPHQAQQHQNEQQRRQRHQQRQKPQLVPVLRLLSNGDGQRLPSALKCLATKRRRQAECLARQLGLPSTHVAMQLPHAALAADGRAAPGDVVVLSPLLAPQPPPQLRARQEALCRAASGPAVVRLPPASGRQLLKPSAFLPAAAGAATAGAAVAGAPVAGRREVSQRPLPQAPAQPAGSRRLEQLQADARRDPAPLADAGAGRRSSSQQLGRAAVAADADQRAALAAAAEGQATARAATAPAPWAAVKPEPAEAAPTGCQPGGQVGAPGGGGVSSGPLPPSRLGPAGPRTSNGQCQQRQDLRQKQQQQTQQAQEPPTLAGSAGPAGGRSSNFTAGSQGGSGGFKSCFATAATAAAVIDDLEDPCKSKGHATASHLGMGMGIYTGGGPWLKAEAEEAEAGSAVCCPLPAQRRAPEHQQLPLPPLQPSELRLCGLTFHPALAPAVTAAMAHWQAVALGGCPLSAADPTTRQLRIVGLPSPPPACFGPHRLKRNILLSKLAHLLGLAGEAGRSDAPLPAGRLELLHPRAWVEGNDVEDVVPVCVRGLVLPVLVALRDVAPGEPLLRDRGAAWWQALGPAWEVLEEGDGLAQPGGSGPRGAAVLVLIEVGSSGNREGVVREVSSSPPVAPTYMLTAADAAPADVWMPLPHAASGDGGPQHQQHQQGMAAVLAARELVQRGVLRRRDVTRVLLLDWFRDLAGPAPTWTDQLVVLKLIDAGAALGSSAIFAGGLVYGAIRLGRGIEGIGRSIGDSLKGVKSTPEPERDRSGGDHLEAGLERLGDKLASRPIFVKATITVAKVKK
eukprot:XP_001695117.1 predicted protein [Chlamydomonas reinhardtii]